MNHVPLALNPLNPAVRSSLIWQMLYLMGASNSFLSLSWLAPLQYLTQMVVKTHSHRAPHRTSTAGTFFFFFFGRCLFTIHVNTVPGRRSVHSIIWQGEVTEMNIDGMKCLRPNLCPGIWHPACCITKLNQEYRSTILFYYGASSSDNTYLAPNPELGSLDEKKICEKKNLTGKNARGNREPGRQIAQFKLNGCTDRIQVGVGQIELAGFLL